MYTHTCTRSNQWLEMAMFSDHQESSISVDAEPWQLLNPVLPQKEKIRIKGLIAEAWRMAHSRMPGHSSRPGRWKNRLNPVGAKAGQNVDVQITGRLPCCRSAQGTVWWVYPQWGFPACIYALRNRFTACNPVEALRRDIKRTNSGSQSKTSVPRVFPTEGRMQRGTDLGVAENWNSEYVER